MMAGIGLGRLIYGALGVVEVVVDVYGWLERKLRRKPAPVADVDRTEPLPLRPRPSRTTDRLPRPPRVPRI